MGQTEQSIRWWAPWALPVASEPIADAYVEAGADGRIAVLEGGISREDAGLRGAELLDDCVIAPGFVNAHAHLEYAAYDGVTDALPFGAWIGDHMRRKARLSEAQQAASAELGAWQAAAGGVTCVGDAAYAGAAAGALTRVGLRGRVYLEIFDQPGQDPAAAVAAMLARLAQLRGDLAVGSDLVELGISPHAPYTVSPALYRAVAETGLPWMTHVGESAAEQQYVLHGSGPLADGRAARGLENPRWNGTAVGELRDTLSERVVIVHGIHLTGADLELMAQAGAGLAHCPRSNARLGCGVLTLDPPHRAGVTVGLGTDSPASAGPIDAWAELRAAIELQRAITGDATTLPAGQALRMATADAARVLGYAGLGILRAGAHADLVAVRVGPTRQPTQSYVLLGQPALVQVTAVAGRTVWRHDWPQLDQARANAAPVRQLLELPVPVSIR